MRDPLDTKLHSIVTDIRLQTEDSKYAYMDDGAMRFEDNVEWVAKLKQAFADDAKQKLMDGSIHGVGVYEVEQHESADWNRMTGQEWYDRFEKELGKWSSLTLQDTQQPLIVQSRTSVMEAAKKAAGIK